MLNKLTSFVQHHRILLILVCCGLAIKFFFAPFYPFKTDMASWRGWGAQLYENGIPQFYGQTSWTDYTPGYLYILWLVTVIKQSFLPNLTPLGVEFLYKLFPILFDVGGAVMIYLIIDLYFKGTKRNIAYIATAIYLLFPHTTMNTAIWGQADSVHTFFLLLSWYLLLRGKLYWMVICFTLACVVKPLSGLIVPIVMLILIKQPLRRFALLALTGIATFMLVTFPFWGISAPIKLFEQLNSSYEVYPYSSLNTYNFWGGFGFWQKDDQTFIGSITAEQFAQYALATSLILVFLYITIATQRYRDTRDAYLWYTLGAALCIILGITFASRMHERYLYHFFPFLLLFLTLYYGSHRQNLRTVFFNPGFGLLAVLAAIHFINLYYVYVLYLFFDTGVPSSQSLYFLVEANNVTFSWLHVGFTALLVWFSVHVYRKWPRIIQSL